MLSFFALSPFDDQGRVQMVVETPRGSSTKFKFDDQQGIFKVSRGLALGVTYPFDWGFVPGTSSDDGDALDALCLHDQSSFPGIVLACRCLAALSIDQKGPHGRIGNPRLILAPAWEGVQALDIDLALTERARSEIEQFFLNATLFTGKDVRIVGWPDTDEAEQLIRTSAK
jgi:inorganic pyrophosphatase